jgi:hypothetical protein
LIDNLGHFLAARHVIEDTSARDTIVGSIVGLIVKIDNNPGGAEVLQKDRQSDDAPRAI